MYMPVKAFSEYPPFEGDCIIIDAIVESQSIAHLCRIMELYEGISFVRTKDPRVGLVEFWVSPSFIDDFRDIFESLAKEISMKIIGEEE
jgi:Domain of unknown function (DUF4911)